jgi:hypothetical protein
VETKNIKFFAIKRTVTYLSVKVMRISKNRSFRYFQTISGLKTTAERIAFLQPQGMFVGFKLATTTSSTFLVSVVREM